jgi:hypothetical protein
VRPGILRNCPGRASAFLCLNSAACPTGLVQRDIRQCPGSSSSRTLVWQAGAVGPARVPRGRGPGPRVPLRPQVPLPALFAHLLRLGRPVLGSFGALGSVWCTGVHPALPGALILPSCPGGLRPGNQPGWREPGHPYRRAATTRKELAAVRDLVFPLVTGGRTTDRSDQMTAGAAQLVRPLARTWSGSTCGNP